MSIEDSLEDLSEAEKVERFMSNSCKCQNRPKGSLCSSLLKKVTIEKCRNENSELTRDELDLVILAQLQAFRSMPDSQPTLRMSHHTKTANRSMTEYYIHGAQVCRKTFNG